MRASDNELLRRYLRDHSEAAFAELVERYLGLVYSAALRQTNGDAPAAEDITQAVFIDLAQKASRLLQHPTLTGWLYTSTRFLAANARRAALRRRGHEQSAQIMIDLLRPDEPEQDWAALRPVLDEAMHDLQPADRDAVLWRYFEKHAFAEIGARLGLNENAARMRVERALDKLREALVKRGVTSSASVLAALVTNQAIGSIPANLAGRVCRASIAAAKTAGVGTLIAALLMSSKTKIAFGLLALAVTFGLILGNWVVVSGPSSPSAIPPRENPGSPAPRMAATEPVDASGNMAATAVPADNHLRLKLVAGDTGEPVMAADVRFSFYAVGSDTPSTHLLSDQRGFIDVTFPTNVIRIEFLTGVEGFADTLLVWQPPRGETIPSDYVLRLGRAVLLGGWVMDANGAPVAGATVKGSYPGDALWDSQRETQLAEFEAQTDASGKWQSRRIAPGLVRTLRLHANHPAYGSSESVFVSSDAEIEPRLREESYTLRLAAAAVVRGLVIDPKNNPVAGAKVLLGHLYSSGSKETTTAADGSFEFAGVPSGKQFFTADAKGFATTTVQLDVQPESGPIQLALTRGKPLLIRVVDLAGQPLAQADVWLSAHHKSMERGDETLPELRLGAKTDAEGRVRFAHVPEADVNVGVSAKGYMGHYSQTRPGEPELIFSLEPELVLSGTVRDGSTGELIPRFKITLGYPESQGPSWSTIGRFQLSFEGGSFRHVLNEPVSGLCTNTGSLLKFEAEGYTPFISRCIAPDERFVQLDITLQPATPARQFTVLNPDGTPAAWADVGLLDLAISNRNSLALVPGGFARNYNRGDNVLQRADDQGRWKGSEEGSRRIIAATSAGYAEVDLSKLPNGIIQLQPWGQVEGILPVTEGEEAVHEVLFVYQNNRVASGIMADFFSTYRIKPDSAGRFVFPLVPPGRHRIVELIPVHGSEGHSSNYGRAAEIEVRAGEVTEATLQPVVNPN